MNEREREIQQLKGELSDTLDNWEGCDYADLQHYYRSKARELRRKITQLQFANEAAAAADRIDEKHGLYPEDGRDRTGAVMWHLGRASAFEEAANNEGDDIG